MPERPTNNLPPGSQPWARDIVGAVDLAQFEANKANMNNRNAFKTINATLEQLSKQQQELTEQQQFLSGLKTKVNEATFFPITTTATNGSWVWLGPTTSVTLDVPTGRALVTVNCPYMEAAVNRSASMWYGVGYSLTGSSANAAYSYSFGFGTITGANQLFGSNATLADVILLDPGTYTFTASRAYFGNSLSTDANLKANPLRIIVQVVENS